MASGESTAAPPPKRKCLAGRTTHAPLNITDHYQAVRKVLLKVKPQWRDIGLALGIPLFKLNEFSGSFKKKIDRMVEVWLNQDHTSWEALVTALRDDTVEGGRPVADEIEAKYLSRGQSVSQAEATQSQSVSDSPPISVPQPTGHPSSPQVVSPRPTGHPWSPPPQPTRHPSSPPPRPTEFHSSPQVALPRPDTPLTRYADYLRSVYKTSELPVYYPKHGTKFINLAVISKEDITKKEADEFTKATLRGDVDQILRVKEPIKMEHVLTPDQGKRLKCVLVEGGPGVGKSTFSWELCKRWGEGQLFQEYSAVVLLRLRDECVQRATCLSDLFYYSDEEVQKQIVSDIVMIQGKDVLIVLDGADELPRNLLKESSVFGRLLSGIDLPLATVLVTSCPSATEQLFSKWKSRISKHIEAIGFREKDIEDYIGSALPSDDLPGFKEYLSIHPNIKTMMYIPLNSAIVTEVYKHCRLSDNTTPTTVTQLYTNHSQSLLLRYLDRHPEYQNLQCELREFSDLPAPVLSQFKRLCEIAHKGVCSQKIVFSDFGRSFDHLGFMHSATDVYAPLRASVSYSFLHLSIQEYLAAVHISLMSSDEQTKLFRSHWEEEHLRNTWRFVAGITQLKSIHSSVLKEVLLGLLTPDTVELLYEAQDVTVLSDPSSTIRFRGGSLTWTPSGGLSTLTPSACVALAYCIAHSRCVWNLSRVIVLEDDEAQILARGLEDCDASRAGCIHTVEYSGILAQVFTDMPQHVLQGIKAMGSLNVQSTAECMRLAEVIPVMSNLHTLELWIHKDVSEEVQTELCHRLSQLRVLSLSGVSFSALKHLLLSSQTLEELRLYETSPETTTLTAEALCTNCSLKTLKLILSRFNLESARAFAAMLRVNQTLTSVGISHCSIDSDCAQCLAEALVHNNTLEKLDMSGNDIGVAGANAMAKMLEKNRTLKTLDLRKTDIGIEGAELLINSLKYNHHLEQIWLPFQHDELMKHFDGYPGNENRLGHLF